MKWLHLYIYILYYLPTGTPPTPRDLREVYSMYSTENSVHILQWHPTSLNIYLLNYNENLSHSKDVTSDSITYYVKPRQEYAFVSIVAENRCGHRSNMSNTIYLPPDNCKWIHLHTSYTVCLCTSISKTCIYTEGYRDSSAKLTVLGIGMAVYN